MLPFARHRRQPQPHLPNKQQSQRCPHLPYARVPPLSRAPKRNRSKVVSCQTIKRRPLRVSTRKRRARAAAKMRPHLKRKPKKRRKKKKKSRNQFQRSRIQLSKPTSDLYSIAARTPEIHMPTPDAHRAMKQPTRAPVTAAQHTDAASKNPNTQRLVHEPLPNTPLTMITIAAATAHRALGEFCIGSCVLLFFICFP